MKKKNSKLFWLIIIFIVAYLFLGKINFLNAPSLDRNFYKNALELEQKREYKNAYYAFKKVSPFYCVYDGVLYHQANCAANIEDEKTAIKKLETLITKFPKSKLLPAAYYRLGQAYMRTGQIKSAEKTFHKIAEKYPDSEYKIAAYYYVGRINKKKNLAYSISLWKKYLELSPSGRFGIECIDELKACNAMLSNNDRLNIGITYYLAEKYGSAVEQFQVISIQKSWCYLAKCYIKTRQNDKAAEIIKTGLTQYAKYTPKDDLVEIVKLYSNISPKTKIETWGELVNLTQNTQAHDYALFNLAKISPDDKSISIYKKIIREYPHGDFASESMWEMMWDDYKHKKYKQALKISKIHRHKFKNSNASAKVLFWTGKIFEKQNKKQQALNCYDEVLENYNTSYYAFRANGRIKALKNKKDPMWSVSYKNRLNDSVFSIKNPYPAYKMYAKYGREFLELVEIGDFELVSNYDITDELLDSWVDFKKGKSSISCLKARNIIDAQYPNPAINNDVCKLAFPLHYVEEINSASKRNRLDAAIIISIIKEESHFNPEIKSTANALGLMQLLPSTAAHIADRNGLNYSKSSDLLKPKTNIKLGSTFLKSLYNDSGNMLYAVASYNAGPGAVKKWINNYTSNDLDAFVEDIPYPETQNYVKKVYRSYWCYKRLY